MDMKRFSSLIILFTIIFLTSCGKEGVGPQDHLAITDSEVIIGRLEWYDIASVEESHEMAFKNSSAVASVYVPEHPSRCTGFLISQDVLMTNHHCIPEAKYDKDVVVTFDLVAGVKRKDVKRYDCSEFIGSHKVLDYAIVRCKKNPGQIYGQLTLSEENLAAGDEVYVLHQN